MKPRTILVWTEKQSAAAVMLAAGRGVRAVARAVGAGESSVYDWLVKSEYKALVADLRNKFLDRAIGQLSRDAIAATRTVRKLLRSPNEAVQLGAAKLILEQVRHLQTHAELAGKVAQLELLVKAGNTETARLAS